MVQPLSGGKFLFFTTGWLLYGSLLFTQNITYSIKKYTTSDGLANNQIKSITKDTTGFLWIATFDGLSRFDGYEFKNYYHDPNDSASIPAFDLFKVLVDRDNQVWIFGPNTICRFNRDDESFIRHFHDGPNPISSTLIIDACLDQDSTLWILGDAGFDHYDGTSQRFMRYHFPAEIEPPSISTPYDMGFDNRNTAWLFTRESRARVFQGHMDSLAPRKTFVIDDSFTMNRIVDLLNFNMQFTLFEDTSGQVWIPSTNGIFRSDRRSHTFIKTTPEDFAEHAGSPQPTLWADTGTGLVIYHPSHPKVIQVDDPSWSIPGGLYIDHHTAWLGGTAYSADGLGLNEVMAHPLFFHHILIPGEHEHGKTAIFGLLRDPAGILWAGIRGKPYLLRIEPNGAISRCNYSEETYLINGNHPRAIQMVGEKIFVGYLNNYMYWFNPQGSPESLTTVIPANILTNSVLSGQASCRFIFLDYLNRIIVGGFSTVKILDPEHRSLLKEFFVAGGIYSVIQDQDSVIWLGSTDTLYTIKKDLSDVEKIPLKTKNYNVEAIVQGDDGVLWLAMMGGGVGKFTPETNTLRIFSTRDGLSNNFTYDMLKDSHGNLWVSTNKGISMFNPETNRFRNFGPSEGLQIEEFNADAAFRAPDGELIFGGMGGIVRFYPDSVLTSDPLDIDAPLLIHQFRASGDRLTDIHDSYQRDTVWLPKGTSSLFFRFTSPDFRNADKILYRYKLNGISRQWTNTDHRNRNVRFAGLKPGRYRFEVEATDLNGNWSKRRVLTVVIAPYFHQTWWFRGLVAGILIFTLLLLYFMQRRQLTLKEQRKIAQIKLDSLRSQLNPHFLFNSLNSINYFISTHDQLSANRYITGFSRLMRSILTNSSMEYIPLEAEVQAMEDYCKLEHLRFGDKFDYQISIDPMIQPEEIDLPPTMVQPFVENAIWHGVRYLEGRKGMITITYMPGSSSHLVCIVTDDGIGRKASAMRKSEEQKNRKPRGIALIHDRLAMMNDFHKTNLHILTSDLYPDQEETGTNVTIEIPIKPTHHDPYHSH